MSDQVPQPPQQGDHPLAGWQIVPYDDRASAGKSVEAPKASATAPVAAPPQDHPLAGWQIVPDDSNAALNTPQQQAADQQDARTGILPNFEAGAYSLANRLFGGLKTPQIIPEKDAPLNPGGPVQASGPLDYAARGAGAGLIAAPLAVAGAGGVGEALSGAASSVASGAGAGAGSYAGEKLAPQGYENVGSLIGGLIGGAGAPAAKESLAARARMEPESAALAENAMNKGIPLSVPQLSGSWLTKTIADLTGRLPFSGAQHFAGTQQQAFNRAVADTFGEGGIGANKITPELLQRARDRLGDVFDRVAARTNVKFDPQLGNDLSNIITSAPQVITPEEMSPITRQLQNIVGKVQPGGVITGSAYQALTRKGTPLDLAIQSRNPNISQFATQIRGALDDALQRSASPDDLTALQQARTQWKALRTVEPLTMKADTVAGPSPATGDISPSTLMGAVQRSYRNAPTAQLGEIPLKDLAQIGQRFLKEPKSSGTAERSMVGHGLGTLGTAIGAGMAGHEYLGIEPLHGAAALLGGGLAGRLGQMAMRNQTLARAAVENALRPPTLADVLARNAPAAVAGATANQP